MKVQSKAGTNFAALDDSSAGEGLAIFFSQSASDNTRWRFDVYARLNTGQDLLVGFFYVSPPNATNPVGPLTRQVGAAVCPGAVTWNVVASPGAGSQAASQETGDITLISSKCCTAPVGVSRVGERYGYSAGAGNAAIPVVQGQTITGISAVGLTGGGTVVLGPGNTITVPAGVGMSLEPQALIQLPVSSPLIVFTNVDWVVEYKESA